MTPAEVLYQAVANEQAGHGDAAIGGYEAAIEAAEKGAEPTVLAEALRRLGAARHKGNEPAQARALCRRSHDIASAAGQDLLAAQALNTLGAIEMADAPADARRHFEQALALGNASAELRARVEQNLGILAGIQGDADAALAHYHDSLQEYEGVGDEHGCALAYHNLGMLCADGERYEDADRYYGWSLAIAGRVGDTRLQGLCLVNRAEGQVACQQFEDARVNAERALALFDRLGASAEKSSAYRVLGMVYREIGRPALAESRLRTAMELAHGTGSVLGEAKAARELALLYQEMGRNQLTLTLLHEALRLFDRLDARRDLVHMDRRLVALEDTYATVVREWGQPIESADSYTFGHCERVAQNAVAVARALGLGGTELTVIRLGAYLHDVGKVRVPHEILNKPGSLTQPEFELVKLHPVWGIELLADVDFPWDLKPIIRWHHERYDGAGYPDRLAGDQIPASAQVVGIVDVYDALSSRRAYRAALTPEQAFAEVTEMRGAWSPAVFDAFLWALPQLSREGRGPVVSSSNPGGTL